jgi:hypothetical protein
MFELNKSEIGPSASRIAIAIGGIDCSAHFSWAASCFGPSGLA